MKISRKNSISRRVARLRQTVKVNTQKTRKKMLDRLEEIFDLAVSLAKGEVETQTVDGAQVRVTLKQRQIWARVAAYVAQIMNSIAQGFDEREIDVQLDELERLVNEAKAKAKNEKTQRRVSKAKEDKTS